MFQVLGCAHHLLIGPAGFLLFKLVLQLGNALTVLCDLSLKSILHKEAHCQHSATSRLLNQRHFYPRTCRDRRSST